MAMDRDTATTRLVDAYFDRYGPASLRDATWWSGLSRTAVVTALANTRKPLVAVTAPWSTSTMYMYRDRLEQFYRANVDEPPSGLNLLAHEDVALKAYFDTRCRYLDNLDPGRVFNQIGEVLPTVVNNGRVIGTWSFDPPQRRIAYRLARGQTTPDLRKQVEQQARHASRALQLGRVAHR